MTTSLRPEVAAFTWGPLVLRNELETIRRVRAAGAREAVVFHCSRVLEALCAAAVAATGLRPPANVFESLEVLAGFGAVNGPRLMVLHSLRRMGNDVRHLRRPMLEGDDDAAAAFSCCAMDWYFVRRPIGPALASVTMDGSWPLVEDVAPRALLEGLCTGLLDLERLRAAASGTGLRTPVLPALIAEALIGQDALDECEGVLARGLSDFPGDLRLRQLRAWWLRLRKRVDESLAQLDELRAEAPDDIETLCFLGGTWKRLAAADPSPAGTDAAAKAARFYRQAFKVSRDRSGYAGINAATMAILAGELERGAHVASKVVALYEERRLARRLHPGDDIPFADYYDHVTYAESLLLVGRIDEARREYRAALEAHSPGATSRTSTLDQLACLLRPLGWKGTVDDFLRSA